MHIPDKGSFQPTPETLKKWLSTRKPTLNVGGGSFPAFFKDEGNSSDTIWFIIAVVGEIIGLVVTVYGGFRSGGIFLILACLAILMFIFLDFFFAAKLHRKKGVECELKSRIMLKNDTEVTKITELTYELKKGRFWDFLLVVGIICIALLKIFGIVVLGVFNNLALYAPIAIIYLVVAYVHIYHTGYWGAYFFTERAIAREHREFAGEQHNAQNHVQRVVTENPLHDLPIKHSPHAIDQEGDDDKAYIIRAHGVLTDTDIINLISGQSDNNKITILKACRKLQLETFEAAENN